MRLKAFSHLYESPPSLGGMGNSDSGFLSCPGGWQSPEPSELQALHDLALLWPLQELTTSCLEIFPPASADVAIFLQSLGLTHQGPEHREDPWCSHDQEPPQGLRVVVLHHLNDPEQGLHPRPPEVPHIEPFQIHQACPGSKIIRQEKSSQNFRVWWVSLGSTVTP